MFIGPLENIITPKTVENIANIANIKFISAYELVPRVKAGAMDVVADMFIAEGQGGKIMKAPDSVLESITRIFG